MYIFYLLIIYFQKNFFSIFLFPKIISLFQRNILRQLWHNFSRINNIILLLIFLKAPQGLTLHQRIFLGSGAQSIPLSFVSFLSVVFDRPYILRLVSPAIKVNKNLNPTDSKQVQFATYLANRRLALL